MITYSLLQVFPIYLDDFQVSCFAVSVQLILFPDLHRINLHNIQFLILVFLFGIKSLIIAFSLH